MANERRLAVLASGRGSDLQSLLDARREGKIHSRVVVVASDNAEAKALERARRSGIAAVAVPPDASRPGPARRQAQEAMLLSALEEHAPDLVVLAGYMRILSPTFVRRWERRLINIHPALLPSFPGIRGQKQAVDWGVRVAGCTTHFVDKDVDHGPIILQAAVPVEPSDDEQSLSQRILQVEHQLLPRTIDLWEEDRLRISGRRVLIEPDESWTRRYSTVPGVLYGPGY